MAAQIDIVVESQRLRDYLLRRGGVDQADLIYALKPFEDSSQVTSDDHGALRIAFQATKEKCSAIVDDLTLNEVLNGNSPYQQKGNVIASAGVTLIGVILVVLAVYFANWSQRATQLLVAEDNFADFDHFGRMTQLIARVGNDAISGEEAFSTTQSDSNPTLDLTPENMFILETLDDLTRHYQRERSLLNEIATHSGSFVANSRVLTKIRRELCPHPIADSAEAERLSALSNWQKLLGCIQPRYIPPRPPLPDEANDAPDPYPGFQTVAWYRDLQLTAQRYAARTETSEYTHTLQTLGNWVSALERSLSTVSQVYLPVLYGALGSIVYCMWRLLNSATSPLGFWHTVLRTSFAGLAALTLSALIVPSNTLAMGTDATRPFVYMLAFIFGYSIEAFVNTLNALNRVLVTSIGPREKK